MVDHLTIFQRQGNVDHARFGKQIARRQKGSVSYRRFVIATTGTRSHQP
jgi:hypothetical protein